MRCDELLFAGRDAAAERAAQLLGGDAGLVQGLRRDQVADRFGLSQIEAAMEEGALGEFAGPGEASAGFECTGARADRG